MWNRVIPKLLYLFFIVAASLITSQSAIAATGSQFKAGRIIDDALFTNKDNESVQSIQNFLNTKMPSCDTNGEKSISYRYNSATGRVDFGGNANEPADPFTTTSRAVYGDRHHNWRVSQGKTPLGSRAPYTCLKSYSENGKSAAQIVWEKAQQYSINPRVLLVTLQKEQGLVQDDWPWQVQYNTAMGFACLDNGQPCDPNYLGFTTQMHEGTRHFRGFFDQTLQIIPHRPGPRNFIAYQDGNVDPNCGTKEVFIENRATAALYSYTPYTPNQAALDDLYGNGDLRDPAPPNCSSFGNRNFWRDYTDWFGTTWWTGGETNINWLFENLDGGAGGVPGSSTGSLGKFPKMIEFNSALHSFYYDASTADLRHAWAPPGQPWQFESLDGSGGANGRISGNVGETPSVLIHGGVMHVFYHDATNGNLRHAWSNAAGDSWSFETLDGAASGNNGAINARLGLWASSTVYNGGIQLFYYDYQNGRLRHAWNNGGWNFENLDGGVNSVGRWNGNVGDTSAVGVYNNTLQLYYYDATFGNLRHAWADSAGWHFENLDGTIYGVSRTENNMGRNPTLTTYGSSLQLFYTDNTAGNLRHAWVSPSQPWRFENLDGDPASVGKENANLGITPHSLVYSNILYVFYYDQQFGRLRHAYSDTSGWHFGNVDGSEFSSSFRVSNAGIYPNAIPYPASNPQLQMLYYDLTTNSLRHAWGPLKP